MNPTEITSNEDFALHLSSLVSNEVCNLTGLPITESEDAHLAIMIAGWLQRTKVDYTAITVVEDFSQESKQEEDGPTFQDFTRTKLLSQVQQLQRYEPDELNGKPVAIESPQGFYVNLNELEEMVRNFRL